MPRKSKQKKLTNYIAIALDTSGSMSHIREDVRRAYNEMLRTIRQRSEEEGHDTFVSLVMFDDRVEVVYYPTDVRNVQELAQSYPIRG
jgi:Mg-chelatase subunit ChlD